ncbi:MAG: hypothetical protein ACOYJG_12990 [Prevotella sp.]
MTNRRKGRSPLKKWQLTTVSLMNTRKEIVATVSGTDIKEECHTSQTTTSSLTDLKE